MAVGRKREGRGRASQTERDLSVRAIVFVARLFEYECRELGVSLAQYRLLLYLRHGPKRAGELAAQAAITRPSLSVLLVALEKAGFVSRGQVDGDGRGVRIELTRKGLTTIERVEGRFGEVLEDATQSAGVDRPQLTAALAKLAVGLTDQVEQRVRVADPFKARES